MKCSNCGAELSSADKNCPYCGSEIPREPLPKVVCARCGSDKITFKREQVGTKDQKNGRRILYRTVGLCEECGFTWNANANPFGIDKHSVLWWILAVTFCPIFLSVWFYKTEKLKLNKPCRAIILAAIWLLPFVLFLIFPGEPTTENVQTTVVQTIQDYTAVL